MPAEIDAPDRSEIEIWPENWPTVLTFLASWTQWRIVVGHERAVWLGLDYACVDVVMRRHPEASWDDLQVMEAEALPILNED